MSGDRAAEKRRAAIAAAELVPDGAVVGLGSGSTVRYAIEYLGEQVAAGDDIVGVPTSTQAADRARSAGIPVRHPADVPGIDIAIDGADQVAGGTLIKGGGGAHLREKIIAQAAAQFVVIVDSSKVVDTLDRAIPVEVLPAARSLVIEAIESVGGHATLREHHDYPVITENGNELLDCDFGTVTNPQAIAASLADIPGILEHGLFLEGVDTILVGTPDGGVERYP